MAKAIHMMVRVLDEARSVQFYAQAFDLEIAERVEFDSFTLIYMRNAAADFEIELTVNKGVDEAYDLGNGYGHVAFVVEDLAASHAKMVGHGLAPGDIKELQHNGKPFGRFFFIADPDGYKIEVLQKGGRFQ